MQGHPEDANHKKAEFMRKYLDGNGTYMHQQVIDSSRKGRIRNNIETTEIEHYQNQQRKAS